MEAIEILKPIASACGYIITIITLATILFKPMRSWLVKKITNKYMEEQEDKIIDNSFKEIKEMIQEISESIKANEEACARNTVSIEELMTALQSNLRNTITHLYYKYTADGSDGIPIYEKENLIYLYKAYTDTLKGNSFVKEIYDELMELPVVKTVKQKRMM